MLLSGFTFIRNAIKFDFPIRECIESMLPIVDELVVNVGRSEDGTEKFIENLKEDLGSSKIRLLHHTWDEAKTRDGLVLSEQTNLALDACAGRWGLYLQADEALHEKDLGKIRETVSVFDALPVENQPEGLRFPYLHFYGGYTLVQRPWNWYPSEIRVIRRNSGARSFGDAQTFRIKDSAEDRKLHTARIDVPIFHYGHARAPETMARKIHYFHRFWHGDDHKQKTDRAYSLRMKDLVWYWGTHPSSYAKRVSEGMSWSLRPEKFFSRPLTTVAIYYDEKNAEQERLCNEISTLLEQALLRPVRLGNRRQWLRWIYTHWMARHRQALIDLRADEHGFTSFPLWAGDAVAAFSWRIAHSRSGKLSRLKQRVYSAIHWTSHENTAEGFAVPRSQWAFQIMKWLGASSH